MQDDETSSEFIAELCDIVNSSFALGTKVYNVAIKWKILRSLPKRFNVNVASLEKFFNIQFVSVEDLVGSILTFENNLPIIKTG